MSQAISILLQQQENHYIAVGHDQTVDSCIRMMNDKDIGALVVHKEGAVVGLISERDIVRRLNAHGLDPKQTLAEDIAYRDVSILDANDSIEQVMAVITKTKRRHVLIRQNGEVSQVVSIGDVMKYLLDEKGFIIEQLENYISASY